MQDEKKKYRIILIQAFQLPASSPYRHRALEGPKEKSLQNFDQIGHLLADVEWDLHPGALTSYGDWQVENQEEFCHAAAGRLGVVREACASGKYNAIEEDGAEVIMFGCSALFWLQPFLEKRLNDIGWEIPVIEGYRCAIELAKAMVNLGMTASGLTYPADRPKKWRRRKLV